MVIRRLAREARPNQRLQRTSAAQTSFDPRLPVSRANVKPANVYVKTGTRQRIGSKQRKEFYEPLIAPSAGLLPRDLTGRTGTHRGLAEKESWN